MDDGQMVWGTNGYQHFFYGTTLDPGTSGTSGAQLGSIVPWEFASLRIVTNIAQIKFKAQASPSITTSNILINFSTNRYFLTGLTNAIFTNLVEHVTSLDSMDATVYIKNTTAVTMGLVWPAYGAKHGYYFRTNSSSPILSTTTLASGAIGVAKFTCLPDGTNITGEFQVYP